MEKEDIGKSISDLREEKNNLKDVAKDVYEKFFSNDGEECSNEDKVEMREDGGSISNNNDGYMDYGDSDGERKNGHDGTTLEKDLKEEKEKEIKEMNNIPSYGFLDKTKNNLKEDCTNTSTFYFLNSLGNKNKNGVGELVDNQQFPSTVSSFMMNPLSSSPSSSSFNSPSFSSSFSSSTSLHTSSPPCSSSVLSTPPFSQSFNNKSLPSSSSSSFSLSHEYTQSVLSDFNNKKSRNNDILVDEVIFDKSGDDDNKLNKKNDNKNDGYNIDGDGDVIGDNDMCDTI
jgi:hypothetical protein